MIREKSATECKDVNLFLRSISRSSEHLTRHFARDIFRLQQRRNWDRFFRMGVPCSLCLENNEDVLLCWDEFHVGGYAFVRTNRSIEVLLPCDAKEVVVLKEMLTKKTFLVGVE